MRDKRYAVSMMIFSAFSFSMMAFFVKLSGDLPAIQKSIFRSALIMIVAGVIFFKKKKSFKNLSSYRILLIRVVAGTLGIVLNFYAYSHLVLSDADVILRLNSIFVIIFSWLFLNEKAESYQILAIVVAFIGVVFIARPSFSSEFIPYLVALCGCLFAAIAYTSLRAMSGKVDPLTIIFAFSAFTTLTLLPFVLLNYQPMSEMQFLYLVLAGVFAGFGQYGITLAYKYAPASEVSIYNYFGLIFAAVLSVVFLKQYPEPLSYVGYLLIFASSYLLYRKNLQKKSV